MDTRPAASTTGPTGPSRRPGAGHVSGLTALVPLAWAVLLLFHPAPDPDDLFGSLRQQATTWVTVHLGSLLFIGLTGAVLYLLVRDLRGPAATLAKVAVGAFVLFYGAAEAVSGVATGTLVQHVDGLPPGQQAAAARRQAGAPLTACILLALSAIAAFHAPPIGPVGLLLLAGAVVLLARGQRTAAATTS